MVHEIELLLRNGFSVISIMVDPFGVSKEPFDEVDIFVSMAHRDFTSLLRFLVRCKNFPHLCETTSKISRMYAEKSGEVSYLPNNRVALNKLKYDVIYLQATSKGLRFARDTLGFKIDGQEQNKPV